MRNFKLLLSLFIALSAGLNTTAQEKDPARLTLDRIYNSGEFNTDRARSISWINNGDAFVTIENENGNDQLIKYESKSNDRSIFLSAAALTPEGTNQALNVADFSLSNDESKILIFTNTSRVWRSNTKGDYWVYDLDTQKIKQLGTQLPASSLMFAKFSDSNENVAYVSGFNLYEENFKTGEVTQLTKDGDGAIINGTFDWVYEEEFGARDGFRWNPDGKHIAYWQLDASEIGTFYMINTTDSVYSKPIPIQYPKVGYDPSSAKIGIVNAETQETNWIPVPGDPVQHYIPAIQWINDDLLLIQQLNRKQNTLKIYTWKPSTQSIKNVYTETEDTWVDLQYPDVSANQWGKNDLLLTKDKDAFLRMTENDAWRHINKIDFKTGKKTLLTPGDYDVAAFYTATDKNVYFSASPEDPAQRYLFEASLKGKGKPKRLTPAEFNGINTYQIAPNGKYAIHNHTNVNTPATTRLISLPDHKTIKVLVDNAALKAKLATLDLPETDFFQVETEDGIVVEGRITKPINFDSSKKYPVLFHVYGEPWGQMATDNFIGMYDIFLAQNGFVIINLDNRGTPSLKGSDWRKSIYRKVGVVNSRDQAMATKKLLKDWSFLDADRVSVWGWSGGGSMTLNLMFRYPEIYKTGMSVAPVANQLFYDNVYQERYMGLPQENKEDFIEGSPVTYAKNLEGNLLIVHGTGDDNVHYQNMEFLVNELIANNKQFTMMAYPNRSHGIYEGANTRRHLYTLLTNYLFEHNGK
ncbi:MULTISPECIES: S9 family peptidase [unclassified Leeuwenhoekiella]|uniref:S9 family peptidase n=1 Tax=unclassified Leeuwenhoekiella TaxID=2615029 RepID=UPI000C4B8A05|nr:MULTISPECIES: DPP IV N-terminal domain-containing protein [unclassified Leeuwenhoekiella]MAW94085.1 S9 family peptidase [Leeuwenhoekiella sp.]|tara:strand:- start:88802 stop:91054 length:2253 start_codon:yes stop_codon:yes gene_type:complete